MRHAAIGAALLLAACGERDAFSPGMWATEVSMSADAGELWSSKTERCVDSGGGDPIVAMLSMTPLGPCQADQTGHTGNRLSMTANCMGRPDAMLGGMPQTRVSVAGSRSATSIDGDIEAELVMEPGSAKLTGKLTATRKGDC